MVKALKATTALENNTLSEVQSLINQHKTYNTLHYQKARYPLAWQANNGRLFSLFW